jgi:exodeoxyribonuclease V alpha subunit
MITIHGAEFRVHDRVCQRVNNYQLDENGVFNGDTGTIVAIDKSEPAMVVRLWDGRLIRYSGMALEQLSLAYAVTVHRAQGSEVPCVVLTLHDSQYTLLQRQLLYTAVTRAKKLLIIVGSRRALLLASKRAIGKRRYCRLTERITAIREKEF